VPSSSSSGGSTRSSATSPPATDHSGDPILSANGSVDADVVVQVSDDLKFDKTSYDGKADLTIGLYDQGSMHHTLAIDGKPAFKLEVAKHGDATVADIHLRHGTYTIFCTLPGHRAAGMEAKLVIP